MLYIAWMVILGDPNIKNISCGNFDFWAPCFPLENLADVVCCFSGSALGVAMPVVWGRCDVESHRHRHATQRAYGPLKHNLSILSCTCHGDRYRLRWQYNLVPCVFSSFPRILFRPTVWTHTAIEYGRC